MSTTLVQNYLKNIRLPESGSHKGQNGKLLIIGGSELFHAASRWSLDVASKFVDMVFYSSVPGNNALIEEAKGKFWNGIVVARSEVENYIEEADVVLIGPGMDRSDETQILTNELVKKYPEKKWVIDAGALQMVEPSLLHENCILTPHYRELSLVYEKISQPARYFTDFTPEIHASDDPALAINRASAQGMSAELGGATLVLKGVLDIVANTSTVVCVEGGNPGMTKGGTGDVLAGLVAALYCTHDAFTAAVVGSYSNKKAGDALYEKVGPFFNASDLVEEIPRVLWAELQQVVG